MDEEDCFTSVNPDTAMSNWQQLNVNERNAILQQVQDKEHINALAIEKDWWVTVILKALFQ